MPKKWTASIEEIDLVFPVGDESILSPEKWTWKLNKRWILFFLTTDFSYLEVLNFLCGEYKLEILLNVRNFGTEKPKSFGNFWYSLCQSVVAIACLAP